MCQHETQFRSKGRQNTCTNRRHSLLYIDQMGDKVHSPTGETVEPQNFNRRQSTRHTRRNSKRHSLDQIGDRVHAPARDTVYIDQIGDKVHAAPGDTVELLSFNRRQSTRPSRRNNMRHSLDPKGDMLQQETQFAQFKQKTKYVPEQETQLRF